MSRLINILDEARIKPYLIAEIGINHNGDIGIAKRLIDAAYACGWGCVKFQKRNPDVCVPEKQKGVMRQTPWGEMKYIDYKYKIEFERKQYDIIDDYSKAKPIDWTVSVWDTDSLEFIKQSDYEVPFIKIPSAKLTDIELLRRVGESGLDCIISTGMADWKIVDEAVREIERHKVTYALLHCNSSYPAPHSELNLSVIPEMKKRYGCSVGYSGHEYDLGPSEVAVAIGADIIERHVTLDHNMWGTDQSCSLEVSAMDMLEKRTGSIRQMLGEPQKYITDSEKPFVDKLRG